MHVKAALKERIRILRRNEDGYTMIAVIAATALVTMLMGAAMAATNQDLSLVRRDLDEKRALAAAQAGLADYSFHLNNDTGYWTRCTNVPAPHAVNLDGAPQPGNRRPVPGANDGTTYRIDLIPATNRSQCSTADPVGSMLEQSGAGIGTFRVRSTGYSGDASQSVVATYKQASFLDYIYFTQLETSDPVTYGFPNPSAALDGAYLQCSKFRRDGRDSANIPNSGGEQCTRIVFVDADDIDGPLHTNDDLLICGSPDFGRGSADVIEVSAPPVGWSSGCGSGSGNPNFIGPFVTNAPVLTPPPTNSELRTIAGPPATYTGQTVINLSGNSMTVTNGGTTSGPLPIPTNGVVYVENGAGCSSGYSPFTATYPSSSGCGNALVRGNGYSSQVTIAAENDIIIEDDIVRTGNGLLGLVANNFVRIKHPICPSNNLGCSNGTITSQTLTSCNSGVNGTGTNTNLRIDAAILAIDHSFIVDHYNCGGSLGTLQVNGAIAQKYRGAVGTTGNTGYIKDYNYDDRLRYLEPPHFFDPVESAWHIERETLDFDNN
jgi:Tfp pilus assembly protein PilX